MEMVEVMFYDDDSLSILIELCCHSLVNLGLRLGFGLAY